ncbi:MAG TPA: hypothetical protein PLI06_00755 [Methanofastidiosum sp.]|nr:hypothetical protein [Methanofastidiosum sp.]
MKINDLFKREWTKMHPKIPDSKGIEIMSSIRRFEDRKILPRIKQVAKSCNISYHQARTIVHSLEDLGYIEIQERDPKLFVIANGRRIFDRERLTQLMDKCKEDIQEFMDAEKAEEYSFALEQLLDVENPYRFFSEYLKLIRKGMPDILPRIQVQFSSHKLKLKQKGYLLTEEHN